MSSRPGLGPPPKPPQRQHSGAGTQPANGPTRPASQSSAPSQTRHPGHRTPDTVAGSSHTHAGNNVDQSPSGVAKPTSVGLPRAVGVAGDFAGVRQEVRNGSLGRPQVVFEDESAMLASKDRLRHGIISSTSSQSGLPMAFPTRPGIQQRKALTTPAKNQKTSSGTGNKRAGAAAVLAPPSFATRYPSGGSADFALWKGDHAEDILNDQTVRSGFTDNQNKEFVSARNLFGPHLKSRNQLQTLSAVFVSTLERRQTSRCLSTPSAFKLLPRVTLKDAKREEWLRDLSNPSIALRKLARTIPHGIRGKPLLEQFLGKGIPTARAVWLAKCVGANELRAFRRKGTGAAIGVGAELRWIKEWTACVEQFMEGVIASCGQADWKSKMDYATRLVSHLYAEQLLDQDHYLAWLLSSLDAARLDNLPIWLLQTQIYWKDLIATRKRACRLVTCISKHIFAIETNDQEALMAPVSSKLREMLSAIMQEQRHAFVMPKSWPDIHGAIFSPAENQDGETLAVAHVSKRNEALKPGAKLAMVELHKGRRDMIQMLESTGLDPQIRHLGSALLCSLPTFDEALRLLLEWATTMCQAGRSRLYLACRIIRRWYHKGQNVTAALHSFLDSAASKNGLSHELLSRLIAELVRSKHFSLEKFMQWLIASGKAVWQNDSNQNYCIQLLKDLPMHDERPQTTNLRRTILDGTAFQWETENHLIESAKINIRQQLPELLGKPSEEVMQDDFDLLSSPKAVQFAISQWLRQRVAKSIMEDDVDAKDEPGKSQAREKVSGVSQAQFLAIREILEDIQDFPALADILGIVSNSRDPATLASIADTISLHFRTLAMIGALRPLSGRLLDRYQILRLERPMERTLCKALATMVRHIEPSSQILELLALDLDRCEPKIAANVCSPVSVSETTADAPGSKVDFDEDIERVLYSGTSMDSSVMVQLFQKIVTQIEQNRQDLTSRRPLFGLWFSRLRDFDERTFDSVTHEWVAQLLRAEDTDLLRQAVITLANARCLLPASFVDIAERRLRQVQSNTIAAASLALTVLDLLIPPDTIPRKGDAQDLYSYMILQQGYVYDHPDHLVDLALVCANVLYTDQAGPLLERVGALFASARFAPVVLRAFASNGASFTTKILSSADPFKVSDLVLGGAFSQIIPSINLSVNEVEGHVRACIHGFDELSSPFRQFELSLAILRAKEAFNDATGAIGSLVFGAIDEAAVEGKWSWLAMLETVDRSYMSKVRELAEHELLATPPQAVEATDETLEKTVDHFSRHAAIVAEIVSGAAKIDVPQMATQLTEKLQIVLVRLLSNDKLLSVRSRMDLQDLEPITYHWLLNLLQLTDTHKSSLNIENMQTVDQARLFVVLSQIVVQPSLRFSPGLHMYAFDVTATLSENLSDAMRETLSKHLHSHSTLRDPRISFLFPPPIHPDAWLGLAHAQISHPTPPPATATTRPVKPPVSLPPNPSLPPRLPHQGHKLPPNPHALHQQQRQEQQQQQHQQSTTTSAKVWSWIDAQPLAAPLRRWEILPDPTSNAAGNDTALSLGLFGARKI